MLCWQKLALTIGPRYDIGILGIRHILKQYGMSRESIVVKGRKIFLFCIIISTKNTHAAKVESRMVLEQVVITYGSYQCSHYRYITADFRRIGLWDCAGKRQVIHAAAFPSQNCLEIANEIQLNVTYAS